MTGYGPFYYLTEAFRGLRANSVVNLLAVGTISMAMLIVGVFLLVLLNLRSTVHSLGDRLEMSIYLKDGLSEREKDLLLTRLRVDPALKKTVYLPKDAALTQFKKELKGQEALVEGLGGNPLPDSYEVLVDPRYADTEKLAALAAKIAAYPGVEDVSYTKQGAELLAGLYKATAYGGVAFAVLLCVTVIFIISNSVRLALYSRGQEIELMQWIGATRGFILWPFLLEGMMLSMLGTALAIGILAAAFYFLPQEVVIFLARQKGLDFLPGTVVTSMMGGGALLGLAGGLVSVKRFLE